MAYAFDKKTGEITISGWDKGIAPSPHSGLGDLKNVNISTIPGEASVNFSRVRLDQASVTGGTMTVNAGTPTIFGYSATTLSGGTWIKVTSQTGSPGTTVNNYYFLKQNVVGVSYLLYSDFGTTQITAGGNGTITFNTLVMGTPIDYCVEQHATGSIKLRYYILDANGVIWVSGTNTSPDGSAGGLSSSTVWSAITPHGTVSTDIAAYNNNEGSIAIMYATDSNNKITANYLIVFTSSQILYGKNSDNSGWPSVTGAAFTVWKTLQYSGGFSHHAILGIDQVIYFCDGPTVGVIYQIAGTPFNPAGVLGTDYGYVNAQYILNPQDAATRITQIPSGTSISVIVGSLLNNLYIYAGLGNSASSKPTNILWIPEANVQYFVQANNFIFIFTGNKGNIYLTNGSSVVPIAHVPDYVSGSVSYVQEPYYVWGGAMYLRGRVFFSIKDQTASHTGNCGGVWSFVPTFNYFPEQDVGLSLRLENRNTTGSLGSTAYNGYAPIIFAGQEITAQQGNGPQYIACWTNDNSGGTVSVDFSGTNPYTDGSAIIETDAVPVGNFLDKKTFTQIECKFAANLVTGESVVVKYRTDLEASFASAGTVVGEATSGSGDGSQLSRIILGVNFQKAQIIQLQIILTSTTSSPSYCRLKEVYIR